MGCPVFPPLSSPLFPLLFSLCLPCLPVLISRLSVIHCEQGFPNLFRQFFLLIPAQIFGCADQTGSFDCTGAGIHHTSFKEGNVFRPFFRFFS